MVQKVLHFATKIITCLCTVSCIIVTCSFLSHKINIIINKIAEIGCMIILAIWFITTTHWRANSVKWTPVISSPCYMYSYIYGKYPLQLIFSPRKVPVLPFYKNKNFLSQLQLSPRDANIFNEREACLWL